MHIVKWKKPIWKVYTLYDSVYKETLKVLVTQLYPTLWNPHGLYPTRLLCPWDFPGKNTGMGSYSLLQGIFLTQGSNPSLLHCRQILYHLGHQGSSWTCHIWSLSYWDKFPLCPLYGEIFFFFLSQMGFEFCQKLFCVCWDEHTVFILQFVNIVYHVDWFMNAKESLPLWNKSHSIMVWSF